jgi:hypothetical protein
LLRAVHRALNDAVPVNAPVEEQPLTDEAYMKGPTAFTA